MKAFLALLSRLWSHVVQDVPSELDKCESCREVNCTQARWAACERRRVNL
jgi:hypothetical protein